MLYCNSCDSAVNPYIGVIIMTIEQINENKLKITYEAPNLKIVLFGSSDVITTSGPLGGDGSPDYEEDSWTKA